VGEEKKKAGRYNLTKGSSVRKGGNGKSSGNVGDSCRAASWKKIGGWFKGRKAKKAACTTAGSVFVGGMEGACGRKSARCRKTADNRGNLTKTLPQQKREEAKERDYQLLSQRVVGPAVHQIATSDNQEWNKRSAA